MSETRTPPPPVVLDWDLSRSHAAGDVGWTDLARGQRFWQGDVRLTLKLPSRTVAFELADVRADRSGDLLSALVLRGRPLTLDEAYAEVARRVDELELPRRDLDLWRDDMRSGDFRKDRVFATRRNDLRPALSLEVKHSYDDERPWYLAWEIAWPTVPPAPPPSPRP